MEINIVFLTDFQPFYLTFFHLSMLRSTNEVVHSIFTVLILWFLHHIFIFPIAAVFV
jgi:hypothetical protein